MFPIARVKAMLLSPRTEWPLVDGESSSVPSIYRGYLIWLAAIPAIATFVGFSLVGMGGFGYTFRVPLVSGIVNAVLGIAMALAMVWAMAWIANALAPKFGGRQDFLSAFKLMAYGSTASMVAGIVYVLPALSMLAMVGALYSVYLIWLGVPVLMKCPPARAGAYTAVLVVCGFVAGLVVAAVSALVVPSPASMAGGNLRIETPKGPVNIDTGKLDALAKKMEESSRKMEEAARSGDTAASAKAAADTLAGAAAVVAGATGGRAPIAADDLKAALPASLAGLERGAWEASGGAAMGVAMASAKAEYGQGDRRVRLEITDPGGLAGLAAMAGRIGATGEKQTQDGYEKMYPSGKRMVKEKLDKSSGRTEYTLTLENGVIVEAEGRGVDVAVLKGAVDGLDLARLEAQGRAR